MLQVNRLGDGSRKVTSIQEITGMEGDTITMQELFSFRQVGVGQDGAVQGHFAATGVRPRCWERLQSRGIRLPEALFQPVRRVV